MLIEDEIVEIIEVGEMELMDIEVDQDHLFLANGILTHNSAVTAQGEFDHSHIAGGISKINTSDNLITLYAPSHMKEKGEYDLILQKTRSSASVGQRIKLRYDPGCMRITDQMPQQEDVDKPTPIRDLKQAYQNQKSAAEADDEPDDAPFLSKIGGLMATRDSWSAV